MDRDIAILSRILVLHLACLARACVCARARRLWQESLSRGAPHKSYLPPSLARPVSFFLWGRVLERLPSRGRISAVRGFRDIAEHHRGMDLSE